MSLAGANVLTSLVTMTVIFLGEEIGWRGYLLPRVQQLTIRRRAALVTGFIHGCFHLAAIASVERGVRDWLGTHRVNASGMVTLLDALRARADRGRVPVVYASSAAVYGDCQDLPLDEDAPTRPLSAYGADKLGCELHARVGAHVHGIPSVGLRFFNVYGPRQDPASPYSGVISIFCARLRRGAPVEGVRPERQVDREIQLEPSTEQQRPVEHEHPPIGDGTVRSPGRSVGAWVPEGR